MWCQIDGDGRFLFTNEFVIIIVVLQEHNMPLSNMNNPVMGSVMPHRLDVGSTKGSHFSVWKSRCEDYMKLTKFEEKQADYQMAVFHSCVVVSFISNRTQQ